MPHSVSRAHDLFLLLLASLAAPVLNVVGVSFLALISGQMIPASALFAVFLITAILSALITLIAGFPIARGLYATGRLSRLHLVLVAFIGAVLSYVLLTFLSGAYTDQITALANNDSKASADGLRAVTKWLELARDLIWIGGLGVGVSLTYLLLRSKSAGDSATRQD